MTELAAPSADTAFTLFGRRLFRLTQRWRREMDTRMRAYGITDATWRPLLHLGRHGDGIRQTDLANSLDIECASLTRLLDALERDGLVERQSDPDDRRSKILRLTDPGRAIYKKASHEHEQIGLELLTGISDRDMHACMRVFSHIEAALNADQAAPFVANPD